MEPNRMNSSTIFNNKAYGKKGGAKKVEKKVALFSENYLAGKR